MDYTFSADAAALPLPRRKGTGERVITATIGPGIVGAGAYGWSDNRREQVRHFRLWTYVAIRCIMEECARYAPHVGYVRGKGHKGGWREKGFRERRYQKTMHAVKPHEEVEAVEDDHPLLRLFERPNAWDTAGLSDLIQEWVLFQRLTGNAYWWIIPNPLTGYPEELFILPSHWVYRVGDRDTPTGVRWYDVRPYVGAGEFLVRPAEIVHTHDKNPLHKIDGYSTQRAIDNWADELESAHRARFWQFRNQTGLSGAIELPESYHDPDDVEYERIYAKIFSRLQGESNYGRPAIMGPGMKFIPLKITPVESDFRGTADQLRDCILAAWKVPKEVAGVEPSGSDLSWYAPLQQFCRNCIGPLLSYLGHVLTFGLARQYDPSLRVWWDDPTPDNPEQVNRDLEVDMKYGLRTYNEARAVRGLEAVDEPNADELLVPQGVRPIGKASEDQAPSRHEVNFGGGGFPPGGGGGAGAPPKKRFRGRKQVRRALAAVGANGNGHVKSGFDEGEHPRDEHGRFAEAAAAMAAAHPFPPPAPPGPPGLGNPRMVAASPELQAALAAAEEHAARYGRAYAANAVRRLLTEPPPKLRPVPGEGLTAGKRLHALSLAAESVREAADDVLALGPAFAGHAAAVAASHPDAAAALEAAREEADRRYGAALANAEAHLVAFPEGPHRERAQRLLDRERLGGGESHKAWHEEDHPRGQPGNAGQFGPGGGGAATAEGPKASKRAAPVEKHVARFDRYRNVAVRRRVLHGLRNEAELAKAIDGHNLPDSEPADVLLLVDAGGEMVKDPQVIRRHLMAREDAVRRLRRLPKDSPEAAPLRELLEGHTLHFVEVKTLIVQQGAGAVHMSAKARARKERWEKRYAAPFHTVCFDDRRGGKFSGNRIYYRRGVGSAKLADMERVADFSELLGKAAGG